MANNGEFDKIKRRLDGRHFTCKVFYDYYMKKIDIRTSDVYLRKETDDILNQLKNKFGEQHDQIKEQKMKIEELLLENYKLQKMIKKEEKKKNEKRKKAEVV
jgi:hypothetical protein